MPLPFHSDLCPYDADPSLRGARSHRVPRPLLLACLALDVICIACGGAGFNAAPVPLASVSVQPNSVPVFIGGRAHFSAVVQNAANPAVTWAVQKASGSNQNLGTIDFSGNYVAPNAPPSTAIVTVTATLQSDSSVSGSATVSIQSSLAISPARAGVTTTQELPLKVVTPGVEAANVAWSVDGVAGGNSNLGLISATGSGVTYTPPPTPGLHTIAAALIANPNVTGQATVYVTDFAGTFTWRNDNARSGVNSQEWALSSSTVNSSTFGKLFSCPVDGYVYAQPLYMANLAIPGKGTRNVIFVATENDSLYAFDADASPCQALWPQPTSLTGGQQPIAAANLLQPVLPPNAPPLPPPPIGSLIGVTGTPVIDATTSTLYVVAATQGPSGSGYAHTLYALDLTTGEFRANAFPLEFTVAGFSPVTQLQRSALLLDNGKVYVAFGSDTFGSNSFSSLALLAPTASYHGWLFEFDSTSLMPTKDFDVTSSSLGGGIWQSGGGPSADVDHNVFVTTGDGPPTRAANFGDYSDSVLRIRTAGGLSVADYFTPCDQGIGWGTDPGAFLESQSSAPLLLPDSAGSTSRPHLLMSGTKKGVLYVINRDAMGNFLAPCPESSPGVEAVDVGGPIFSTPLYWNNAVYVAPGQKTSSHSNSLISLPMLQGILSPLPAAFQSRETFGPQGATPVLSANGTSNAVLWLIDTSGAFATPNNNGPAILRAYDPNDLSKELYDSTQAANQRDTAGSAVKFTVPTVANGKVYVGTQTELDVYGLLP